MILGVVDKNVPWKNFNCFLKKIDLVAQLQIVTLIIDILAEITVSEGDDFLPKIRGNLKYLVSL